MEHLIFATILFALIALFHHAAQHKAQFLTGLPWIAFLGNPVTLDTMRDVLIHTFVYSHLSPLHLVQGAI